ncbi:MAG TPA: hypothetical protein EYG85_04950 [Crocinitomix sp.]|nr:hypothetical protein [Crocinitomix sp.]
MDDFLDYIEKYKFAIIATVVIHLLFFLVTNFVTVKDIRRIPSPEVNIEIPLDDIEFDEEMMELLELNKDPIANQNLANMVANENDNREKSYEDYSTYEEDFSESSQMTVEELEAKFFNEVASEANSEKHAKLENIEKHELKQYDKSTRNTTSGGKNAYAGEVMISYNLKGRKAYSLPNPGYTCNGSGTVVIQVKVDKAGNVKFADYSATQSNRATECMINKALKYAKKSRFDYASNSGIQTGTITYKFVGQ